MLVDVECEVRADKPVLTPCFASTRDYTAHCEAPAWVDVLYPEAYVRCAGYWVFPFKDDEKKARIEGPFLLSEYPKEVSACRTEICVSMQRHESDLREGTDRCKNIYSIITRNMHK